MKKIVLLLAWSLVFAWPCVAQTLAAHIQALKASYSASGNIVALDERTILIEPKMPGPLCALPSSQGGRTTWYYYTFPLASITVPLALVDETLIAEDRVFTDINAAKTYKPGDMGDTTMVVIAGLPGKQFHTLIYDRDKLTQLGPGPHSGKEYGQAVDDTQAFGLTFTDPAAARTFEIALKNAVILAKQRTAQP